MFIPHCHHIASFFRIDQGLADSMRLVSALAVENELQESWRREREKSEDERDRKTKNPNDNP
jgi:hypothetical protein